MSTSDVTEAGRPGLQIELDAQGDMTIVRPTGRLSMSTSAALGDTLLRSLSDHPSAVLVDLTQVAIAAPEALKRLARTARRADLWSGVPLMFVAQTALARRLRALSIERYARVFPTVAVAITAAEVSTPRTTTVRRLDNDPRSARTGRDHVARTCADWGCHRLTEDAVAVSDELVSNGLRHSIGALTHRLELRRETLTIAVTDQDPAPPIRIEAAPGEVLARGYGLQIVSAYAAAWGSTPNTTGGKTVWAVLR